MTGHYDSFKGSTIVVKVNSNSQSKSIYKNTHDSILNNISPSLDSVHFTKMQCSKPLKLSFQHGSSVEVNNQVVIKCVTADNTQKYLVDKQISKIKENQQNSPTTKVFFLRGPENSLVVGPDGPIIDPKCYGSTVPEMKKSLMKQMQSQNSKPKCSKQSSTQQNVIVMNDIEMDILSKCCEIEVVHMPKEEIEVIDLVSDDENSENGQNNEKVSLKCLNISDKG